MREKIKTANKKVQRDINTEMKGDVNIGMNMDTTIKTNVEIGILIPTMKSNCARKKNICRNMSMNISEHETTRYIYQNEL